MTCVFPIVSVAVTCTLFVSPSVIDDATAMAEKLGRFILISSRLVLSSSLKLASAYEASAALKACVEVVRFHLASALPVQQAYS